LGEGHNRAEREIFFDLCNPEMQTVFERSEKWGGPVICGPTKSKSGRAWCIFELWKVGGPR